MKALYSKTWGTSKQQRKQRKYRHNAPLHIKRKFLSAHLAKHLRKEYGRRSAIVRKDDVVKILRGKFAGKEGKISDVNTKKSRVFVEGASLKKAGGKEAHVSIDPSNVMIVELNTKDPKRIAALKKQGKKPKTDEKKIVAEKAKTEAKGEKK